MKTTVEALKDYYVEIGGTSTDVEDVVTIPDMIDAITALGGGSSLPDVTAEDNGDVLTVVEGEWTAAAPTADESTLVIPATINTSNYVVTFEVTTAELINSIKSAINDNKNVLIMGSTSATAKSLFQFVNISSQQAVTFIYMTRSTNATIYWTISFTGSESKTTTFTAVTVNDPA